VVSTCEVTPAQMYLLVEQAILALAPCMKSTGLNRDCRRQLLVTIDLLTSIWTDLQRDDEQAAFLYTTRAGALKALVALCEVVGACESDETPLAIRAMYRLVEGWGSPPEAASPPSQNPTVVTSVPEGAPEADIPADGGGELPETEPSSVPPEAVHLAAEAPEPKEAAPEPAQARVEEQNRLSEQMDKLWHLLDYVQNHDVPREEAIALLMACACSYQWLYPQAVSSQREWEAGQLKSQLTQIAKERFRQLWLPALDNQIEFSERELETLQTGYEAMAKSWQMWRWYRQHGDDLDKGTGAPLLESIAAPVPMVQQIWTSKQLLSRLGDQDGAETLRDAVREEAERRKWNLEMLATNSSRQRQLHYIRHADEHWEAAKRQVQKKAQQREAITRLQTVLSTPNPDTFEEDLLCALVACHRVQIPYSNRELREWMRGYHFLLENPAVPEKCGLAKSEQSAARKFLVNLGKQLLKSEEKEEQQEQQPEEEPQPEHNSDLLRKARQWTQGKKLFMLCFHRRAEAEQNIRQALQFAEVDWPDLDGGESVNSMEAHIRHADMTIVVVRYSRTHWKEARDIARQYGKQFVMATKGYGVTHLAQQIVEQCGKG